MSFVTRPMKGAFVDDWDQITYPKMASPKIDGFRCMASDIARTSRLSPFANRHVHESLKGLLPAGVWLDGEIVVGKRRGEGVLTRTSSGVTSKDGEPDWRLWVFDAPRENVKFQERLRLALSHIEALAHPQIRYVKHKWIYNRKELDAYVKYCLERGFEGVMLRDPDGLYKNGKSTMRQQWLLKIKPFETSEARITGYYEETENTNEAVKDATGKSKRSSSKSGKVAKGTLGGFTGTDLKTGVLVRCGGGFSKAERSSLWRDRELMIGRVFTYKAQEREGRDAPQHPTFLHFRHESDIEKT